MRPCRLFFPPQVNVGEKFDFSDPTGSVCTLVDFFCHQVEASVEFRQRFGQLQEVFDYVFLAVGASSLEIRTGHFSKSVTLWTPLQSALCSHLVRYTGALEILFIIIVIVTSIKQFIFNICICTV